jgi:hypothetical protein
MPRYSIDATTKLDVSGIVSFAIQSPRGEFVLDYFPNPADITNATNRPLYESARSTIDSAVLTEHLNMLDNAPLCDVIAVPGTDSVFVGSQAELGEWLARGTKLDPSFMLANFPDHDSFANVLGAYMTGGKIDLLKFGLQNPNPTITLTQFEAMMTVPTGVSTQYYYINTITAPPTGTAMMNWSNSTPGAGWVAESNLSGLPSSGMCLGPTAFRAPNTSLGSALSINAPGYFTDGSSNVVPSTWKSILGLAMVSIFWDYTNNKFVVGLAAYKGFEALVQYYADQYGAIYIPTETGWSDLTNALVPGVTGLTTLLGARTETGNTNLWNTGLAFVGRPFGTYSGLLFVLGSAATSNVANGTVAMTCPTSMFMYRTTFADLARSIDVGAAKETDATIIANMTAASTSLKANPNYTVGALESSTYFNIAKDGLKGTYLATAMSEAGVDITTEAMGGGTVGSYITLLNGLIRTSSMSVLDNQTVSTPYTDDMLATLNNAENFRIEVATVSSAFVFTIGNSSGTLIPQPTWFDESIAKVMLDSGSSMVTFDASDLVAAKAVLDALTITAISNDDSRLCFTPSDFMAAGYPVYCEGMDADAAARAMFFLKGIETPAVREQLRGMVEALRFASA